MSAGLGVLLRLLFEFLHQTMMLHLHLFRIAGAAFDGVLDHRLALQLLRPARQGDRRRVAFMRRRTLHSPQTTMAQ